MLEGGGGGRERGGELFTVATSGPDWSMVSRPVTTRPRGFMTSREMMLIASLRHPQTYKKTTQLETASQSPEMEEDGIEGTMSTHM